MVVKRFIISISVLFFYALLLQAKNEVIDLGLIIGESVSGEIMDKVFKEFCVGK